MGRDPIKANANVYFQARKKAAEYNDALYSREGAAEKLGVSVSTLADYELGNTKVIPVDKVVLMAELYNDPALLTRYCKFECPIHGYLPLATEEKNIQQKKAISALLSKKMRDAHTVDELARMIRPCIGLTEGQAKANARYYDSIVANLRKEHPRMKTENIRRKARDAAQKYAERQHRERAMTIAQTESAFAYNRGADEGVRQAQEQKLLGVVKKRWSTSGDDAVCEVCASLEGMEIEMNDSFSFGGKLLFVGQKMLPPAHPRCACAIEYIEESPP